MFAYIVVICLSVHLWDSNWFALLRLRTPLQIGNGKKGIVATIKCCHIPFKCCQIRYWSWIRLRLRRRWLFFLKWTDQRTDLYRIVKFLFEVWFCFIICLSVCLSVCSFVCLSAVYFSILLAFWPFMEFCFVFSKLYYQSRRSRRPSIHRRFYQPSPLCANSWNLLMVLRKCETIYLFLENVYVNLKWVRFVFYFAFRCKSLKIDKLNLNSFLSEEEILKISMSISNIFVGICKFSLFFQLWFLKVS